uniref:Fatty acyl-CoA reductase n=2 Tax=Stomoxys calcitrans TaxID=35570 RepID=A0A1I8PZX0_STOCA
MDSNIQHFFRDKVVFITGGTGFLGKVLLEKLIRTTAVKTIYMLVRPKAGKEVDERLDDIFNDQLFEKLYQTKPLFRDSIKLIAGDCMEPNLGICTDDRQKLTQNVEVIIHSAATVRFNEALSIATKINVRATHDLLNLAKEMKALKSFVHISTAFVNCTAIHCDERFYSDKLSIDGEKFLNLLNGSEKEPLDAMTKQLVGQFPNTYTFSKCIAEDIVRKQGNTLPLCICRPGGVVSMAEEPLPGWVSHLQGAVSAVFWAGNGMLRVLHGNGHNHAGLVPVDYCTNAILAAAWNTASTYDSKSPKDLMIYNLVMDETNRVKWISYWEMMYKHISHSPFSKMMWQPFLFFVPNKCWYELLTFIFHTLPAYTLDGFSRLMGKEAKLVKISRKMYTLASVLRHFIVNEFIFGTTNTKNLWQKMSIDDQKLYNFDMIPLDWDTFFSNMAAGLRKYIAKEDLKTIPQARAKWNRFYIFNVALNGFLVVGLLWIICKTALFI